MGRNPPPRWESIWANASGALTQLLVPGAILVVGVIIGDDTSTWLIAALSVSLAVTVSMISTLALSQHYTGRIDDSIDGLEGSITDFLGAIRQAELIRAEGREGMTQESLSAYEQRADVQTIWIVGADFKHEVAPNSPFRDVVRDNIRNRKIEYVYVAPDRQELVSDFERLRLELELSKEEEDRLTTIFLPEETWQRIPYTAGNFTIYDPVRKGRTPRGFFWDPGGDGESFIELLHNVPAKWVGQIQSLCPELQAKRYDDEDPG